MCMILHRIQHPEHRIQKVKNAGRGTTVIGEGKSMRHARSSCPAFRSGRKRAKGGEEVGLPGLKRAGMVKSAQFRPPRGAKNRLGPPWPTFAHIDFFEAGFGTNEGNGLLEWWSIGPSGVCQAVLGSKMGAAGNHGCTEPNGDRNQGVEAGSIPRLWVCLVAAAVPAARDTAAPRGELPDKRGAHGAPALPGASTFLFRRANRAFVYVRVI